MQILQTFPLKPQNNHHPIGYTPKSPGQRRKSQNQNTELYCPREFYLTAHSGGTLGTYLTVPRLWDRRDTSPCVPPAVRYYHIFEQKSTVNVVGLLLFYFAVDSLLWKIVGSRQFSVAGCRFPVASLIRWRFAPSYLPGTGNS